VNVLLKFYYATKVSLNWKDDKVADIGRGYDLESEDMVADIK
jgi:hypothetical protein